MSGSGAAPRARNLDRPLGYFPRGTSLGLVGLTGLSVGVPFFTLECAAPLMRDGVHVWIDSIPYVLGVGLLPTFVFIFSARFHKYWTVCFFFYAGVALLVAYVLAVVFALVMVMGLLPERDGSLAVLPIVGLVVLTGLAPAAWFLLRALRLRYWQPGSAPETWEGGDEGPPAWAMSRRR